MKIKAIIAMIGLIGVASSTSILVGTGTEEIYHIEEVQGHYQIVDKFPAGQTPSWILLSNNRKFLFAVNEGSQGIRSFAISSQPKLQLTEINRVSSTGDYPCFLSITSDDKFLGVANYGTNYALFDIDQNGKISDTPHQYFPPKEGHGPRTDRQEKSHPHQFYISSDNKRIYVSDLGTDRIYYHSFAHGQMAKEIVLAVKPGSGPRHLAESPIDTSILYGTNELNGEINSYKLSSDGTLSLIDSVAGNPKQPFKTTDTNGAIIVSKKGFLFASIRGQNKVSVFKIENNGKLTFLDTYEALGSTPRFITLNPQEDKLFVLHQDSATIAVFNVNGGVLSFAQLIKNIPSPQSLVFY